MKICHIFSSVIVVSALVLTGCDNMLRTQSDRFVLSEENKIDNPNDTLYSVAGILAKLQEVGDNYVVLGELRADLMDVTEHAEQELRDISDLNISVDNAWIDAAPYYDVINHCNFVISRIDTSLYLSGKKVMMPDFVAAKAVRAWTYMQLALNFGKAYYMTAPILNIDELNGDFEEIGRDEIFVRLEKDLLPYVDVAKPSYGGLANFAIEVLIPNIRYMLGEIYLWQNEYAKAAQMYYDCIYRSNMVVSPSYVSSWTKSSTDMSLVYEDYPQGYMPMSGWASLYNDISPQSECMAVVPYYYSSLYGKFVTYEMHSLTISQYRVRPSDRAVNFFEEQPYNDFSVSEMGEVNDLAWRGDLRGNQGAYYTVRGDMSYSDDAGVGFEPGNHVIDIYQIDRVVLQRQSLAYLRFAEAVNRLGKPSLAMAVVNNGLNRNLFVTTPVNRSELNENDSIMWAYPAFDANIGTRSRGQGPSTVVVFPQEVKTREDSILYMEKILVEECGLETAFNGNRFHDLMRFSHHNPTNAIIAENIAEKHPDNYDYYYALMLDEKNWYLPAFEE